MTSPVRLVKRMLKCNCNSDKQIILLAQGLARANRQISCIDDFAEVEFSAYSQWGEDGIIDWLISKLPMISKTFVEFGVEDYREANTRLLVQMRNWRGLVIDGSFRHINNIKRQDVSWRYQLDSVCEFVTRDNINDLIRNSFPSEEIGLISIDIDGNDYWVWQAISCAKPVIFIVEYNALLGDLIPLTVPYISDFDRTKAHYSNLYFGASLPALVSLGVDKGYTFVGTNTTGVNAFFVRNDFSSVITESIRNISTYPSLFREARGINGDLLYLSGEKRLDIIRDCSFINTSTGIETALDENINLYSDEWMRSGRRIL